MQYFVVAQDGQRYGPVDLPTLNSWVQQGRILHYTVIVDAMTGRQVPAAQIPGLNLPDAQPMVYSPRDYPRIVDTQADKQANIAIAFGIAGIVVCPLLSLIGIAFAAMAIQGGAMKGKTAMWVCVGTLIVQVLGVLLLYGLLGSM